MDESKQRQFAYDVIYVHLFTALLLTLAHNYSHYTKTRTYVFTIFGMHTVEEPYQFELSIALE